MHHDDGAIRQLIPDLIEAGIDILNPIQWRCRDMARELLARDFGSSLIFHGLPDPDQSHRRFLAEPPGIRCAARDATQTGEGTGQEAWPAPHPLQ
jgi:hypothetical protein